MAVFQVAASDARHLVWELGKERVTEDDVTSLPVHQCYVRATVGTERMPAFSMTVRKPEPGNPHTAELIRAIAADYTPADEDDEEGRKRVRRFKDGMKALKDGETPPEQGDETTPEKSSSRKRRRSKWDKVAKPENDDAADKEAEEARE